MLLLLDLPFPARYEEQYSSQSCSIPVTKPQDDNKQCICLIHITADFSHGKMTPRRYEFQAITFSATLPSILYIYFLSFVNTDFLFDPYICVVISKYKTYILANYNRSL